MHGAAGFTIFAVTADKGIRARGRDLPEVFVNAARGMWSLMVEPGTARRAQMLPVKVEAADRETLLVAWLNELLFLHEVEGFVAAEFVVTHLTETRMEAEVWGERLDRDRHPLVGDMRWVMWVTLALVGAVLVTVTWPADQVQVREQIQQKKVVPGQLAREVRMVIGEPTRITRTQTEWETTEDWVYGEGKDAIAFTFVAGRLKRITDGAGSVPK
jgi:SHS2 domain-containing protein